MAERPLETSVIGRSGTGVVAASVGPVLSPVGRGTTTRGSVDELLVTRLAVPLLTLTV